MALNLLHLRAEGSYISKVITKHDIKSVEYNSKVITKYSIKSVAFESQKLL